MATKKYNLNTKIRSALRKLWLYSPERREVQRRALRAYGQAECEKCHKVVNKVQIDHVVPIGELVSWDQFIERLFCGAENLSALCLNCHKTKTLKEAGARAAARKVSKNGT